MSDQPGAGPLPELTAEQESAVRRLLAEARHDEPIPAEVADRLDRVLAGLSDDVPAGSRLAPVVDLAARRRRRNAAALLAGAAAVIVAGFAIGQVIDVSGSSDGSGTTSAARDQGDSEAGGQSGGQAGGEAGDTQGSAEAPSTASEPSAGLTTLPAPLQLRSSSLEEDLTRQLAGASPGVRAQSAVPDTFSAYGCAPLQVGQYGLGALFPALFDGQPAVVAVRPSTGSTQRADVLACGTADELGSAVIPRR